MCENLFDYLKLKPFPDGDEDECLLRDPDVQLTGKQLWERVMAVGIRLHDNGCFQEPVGVFADHTADTLVGYLGVLASGNHYVPLQPDIPQERFEKIRAQTGMRIVLGAERALNVKGIPDVRFVEADEFETVCVDAERETELAACRSALPPDAPMYVIFTSGSTGEPKGIIKTHRAMISFLDAYIQEFGFSQADRIASQTPFYFDASAKDIYLALKVKCQLHILDERLFVAPIRLAEYLQEEQISVIQWVPSALCMLSRFRVFDQIPLSGLKKVLFVGEVMPVNQLKIWMEALPETKFYNLYGASEVAGICMYDHIRSLDDVGECLPIGYPLPGCEVYLISDGHVVKDPGTVGEIYVRSDTIAAGYLGDPERTAQVFVNRPCGELPEGLYYKSGDLAKYDDRGALVFVSRSDYQIKHMGHRIELGEIESVLMGMSQIESCCCLYEKQKIMLFYEGMPQRKEVSEYLKTKLASYMLPNKIVQLEQMPRNANGKADRGELKKMIK